MKKIIPDLNVHDRIYDRLRRIANVLLLNASFIDNLGLLNGKMGISIFFYHYSRYTQNKIFEDYAGELIDEIYKEINANTPVNLSDGLTGIGWGIVYLLKNKFIDADVDEVLAEIDDSVYRNSLYRPILLESGTDLFGYGLFYLARLNAHDNHNSLTINKKQELIRLTNDCEHILIQKKYLDFGIQSLSIETINSFSWFLLELYRFGIFPDKVEKLFHILPEYFESQIKNTKILAAVAQMITLVEHIIPCIRDVNIRNAYKALLVRHNGSRPNNKITEEELVDNFVKVTWQNLLYDPCIPEPDDNFNKADKILQRIDNEENWNNRLDNLKKNNMGLTGLAGLGLGIILSKHVKNANSVQ